MIEIKNLVKKYGNHVAVDDISFTLQPNKNYDKKGISHKYKFGDALS